MNTTRLLLVLFLASLLAAWTCPLSKKTLVVYTQDQCVDQNGQPYGQLVPAVPQEVTQTINAQPGVFVCDGVYCTPGTFLELSPPFGAGDAVAFSRPLHAEQAHACCVAPGNWACTPQEPLVGDPPEINRIFDEFGTDITPE